MGYLDLNDVLPERKYYIFKGGRGTPRECAEIILNERQYEYWFGGVCWIDYNPRTFDYTILLNNDDVVHFSFSVNRERVKYCTPELTLNRIYEEYMKALEQRSSNYYEEYTRELLGRWD